MISIPAPLYRAPHNATSRPQKSTSGFYTFVRRTKWGRDTRSHPALHTTTMNGGTLPVEFNSESGSQPPLIGIFYFYFIFYTTAVSRIVNKRELFSPVGAHRYQ